MCTVGPHHVTGLGFRNRGNYLIRLLLRAPGMGALPSPIYQELLKPTAGPRTRSFLAAARYELFAVRRREM